VIARQVLAFLNTGAVISRSSLAHEQDIEILEIEVGPDAPATQQPLAQLKLPQHCLIGAVIRENYVMVPGAEDRFSAGDTVVALVDRKAAAAAVEMFSAPKA